LKVPEKCGQKISPDDTHTPIFSSASKTNLLRYASDLEAVDPYDARIQCKRAIDQAWGENK